MSLNNIKPSNFILLCDSYKLHHFAEYPKDTTAIYSTVVPRKRSNFTNEIVAMGASYVAAYLAGVRITQEMIDEAEVEVNQYGYDFNRQDWEYIVEHLDGKLPLSIYGIEEGSVVEPNTPILGVVNNHPKFFWLTSYVETVVQRIMWKMTTVASLCRYIYKDIENAMIWTGSNMSMLEYKLHNFGDRGADGEDSAIMAGIAHAALFSGSDCTSAGRYIKAIYRTNKNYLSSVDATEHSVMCSNSDAKNEDDWYAAVMAVERLEEAVHRSLRGVGIPLQSVVIDTYDDERFVKDYIGTKLKERIINSGGKMVLRPDSGDPRTKPIEVVRWLDETFGCTAMTSEGYQVLHPSVGVIQGDGINESSITDILDNMINERYSIDNIVFGMGGGLTHGGSRDQFSFSMKATARQNHHGWVDLLKQPKTDLNKTSLKGLVRTRLNSDGSVDKNYVVNDRSELDLVGPGWRRYFVNGEVDYVPNFDEVRSRARG